VGVLAVTGSVVEVVVEVAGIEVVGVDVLVAEVEVVVDKVVVVETRVVLDEVVVVEVAVVVVGSATGTVICVVRVSPAPSVTLAVIVWTPEDGFATVSGVPWPRRPWRLEVQVTATDRWPLSASVAAASTSGVRDGTVAPSAGLVMEMPGDWLARLWTGRRCSCPVRRASGRRARRPATRCARRDCRRGAGERQEEGNRTPPASAGGRRRTCHRRAHGTTGGISLCQ